MVKDPNRPKGRKSAYTFFVLSCKDELEKTNQGTQVNYSLFSKNCSERWKALSGSEKKKYEDMAKADEARYNEEMKHYVPPKDSGKKDPSAPKRPSSTLSTFCSVLRPTLKGRVKDPNKPKGRTSTYAFFVLSCMDELKKTNQAAPVNYSMFSMSCLGQWASLSASEKKKFEDMAKADDARYKEEMKHYVPPKDMGKEPCTPKQPTSAFFIFCSENRLKVRSEYPTFSSSEIARKLVEMWSNLSAQERAPYEQKAVRLRGTYEEGPGLPAGSTNKVQGEPEEEEEDDNDEDEDDLEDDEDLEDEEDEDDDLSDEEEDEDS